MKFRHYLLVILFGGLVAGCSDTNLRVVKQVTSLPGTVSLSIADSTGAKMLAENSGELKILLAEKFKDEGIKVATDPKGVVSVTGEFTAYDSGSRALRYLVGFGAGTASYSSHWRVVSAAGEEMGDCYIKGYIRGGWFGGSLDKMHDGLAEAVANCVKGER